MCRCLAENAGVRGPLQLEVRTHAGCMEHWVVRWVLALSGGLRAHSLRQDAWRR